jgi:putative ABC transport system permease protein
MPIYGVRTMAKLVRGMNGLFFFELAAEMAAALGGVGLILAVVGIYGVVSYNVSQRTQEIGIRMALGARPAQIRQMICRYSGFIVIAAMPLGSLVAFGMGKLLSGFLVGVSAADPLTYLIVIALLAGVTLVAGYLPSRRATRVNPMLALRNE